MEVPVLTNQQELINTSFVWTLDEVWKTCWEQFMIGTDGVRESVKSVLVARLGD